MKKLPVGIQNFNKLIEGGFLYADKTEYIYNLIESGQYYFLSRPRRFGKSLLIDTMAEVFSGNRELFKGLWIDASDYEWASYPVIRLDMTQVSLDSPATLASGVQTLLKAQATHADVELPGESAVTDFWSLIEALKAKTGQRVVVLIDEYDKPIIDFLDQPEKANAMREAISNIYGILKGQDANLHFVFLTGVSKFTKTSIFSKLNNLTDITLSSDYAGICGFTEPEFDLLFPEFIDYYITRCKEIGHPDGDKPVNQVRAEIFDWYDGYSWDGYTRVFNPFSLLSFFANREFKAYWFATGTPTFLPPAFKSRPNEYNDLQGKTINETSLDSYDIEQAPLASLLFQTGFLTVKEKGYGPPPTYSLGFPNVEVSMSLAQMFLTSSEAAIDPLGDDYMTGIRQALKDGDAQGLEQGLSGLYASIPYQLHIPAEAFYHAMFLAVMQFMGLRVLGEVSVAKGRIDGVLDRPGGTTWIMEFKYCPDDTSMAAATEQALAQIRDKGYAERYTGTSREVISAAICVAQRGTVQVTLG
jgi:hypothetical protein